MFRRALGSFLAPRFSPRATPRTAPARAIPSTRDLRVGDALLNAYVYAAAASAGACLGLLASYFEKRTHFDDSAAGKVTRAMKEFIHNKVGFKRPDMETRFERWIVKNDKKYRDEDEKAMRFQLFKATVESIESHPRFVQNGSFQEISYFADFTEQETRCLLANPDRLGYNDEYYEMLKSDWAKKEKQHSLDKEARRGDIQATQVYA